MKKNMKISVFRNQIFVLAACILLCGAAACSRGDRPADVEKETAEETAEEPPQEIQDNIMNHPEYLPEMEAGLSFTEWLERKTAEGSRKS